MSKVMMARRWQGEVQATASERGLPGGRHGLWPTHLLYLGQVRRSSTAHPLGGPARPSVISGISEPSLDLVAGRAALSGGWPLCQGHAPQSISSALAVRRVPAPAGSLSRGACDPRPDPRGHWIQGPWLPARPHAPGSPRAAARALVGAQLGEDCPPRGLARPRNVHIRRSPPSRMHAG